MKEFLLATTYKNHAEKGKILEMGKVTKHWFVIHPAFNN